MNAAPMRVAVVGRGAGAEGALWAARGHWVYAAGLGDEQIAEARRRSRQARLGIVFEPAQASALPWPDRSMDLCIVPALAGCAADWRGCLSECVRVLRPGGALCFSIANLGWLARYRLQRHLAPHGLAALERSHVFDTASRASLVAIKPAF